MKHTKIRGLAALLLATTVLLACDFSYLDPRPTWEMFEKEREMAHRTLPQLTPEGNLPPAQ